MKMRIYIQPVIIIALIMVYGFVSCSKEIEYDEDKNKEYWKRVSPVDSIDQNHAWQLANSRPYQFTVNANVEAQRLEIYNANPITSVEAEMMGRAFVKDGQQLTMSVSVPSILTTLYAALIDEDGTYTVTSFSSTERYIDFSNPIAMKQQPIHNNPKIMAYTYCFEENFPTAGDFDYNDLVIRIGLELTGQKQMDVHLTLSAVGASGQIACAIRLVGYQYQDIDSIVAKNRKTLNVNVPKLSYGLIESDDILLKGRNGEAVLNLFVDAHWAIDTEIETINDDFVRKKYNVKRSFTNQYEQTYAKTADFTIYFKNEDGLNGFTQEMIDPFIVTYYMANKIETHLDEFKNAQVLYNYDVLDFKTLPWALKIPTQYFQYPLEGIKIGFRKHAKDGTPSMDGAYMINSHSFGEWVENQKNCLDWYNYPIENQVW